MKLSLSDFVIAQIGTKLNLIKITQLETDSFSGINHSEYPCEKTPFVTLSRECLVANLGHAPKNGTAYGVKIEPYIKMLSHPDFGDVHLWRDDLTKEQLKLIKNAMTFTYQFFSGNRILPERPLDFWVKAPRGRWAGLYKTRPKEESDSVVLMPKVLEDQTETNRLVAHEVAHHVWFRTLGPKRRAAWHDLYLQYSKVNKITQKTVEQLAEWLDDYFDDSMDTCFSVKELASMIDNEDLSIAFLYVVDYIVATYNLTSSDLDDFVASKKDFRDLFPERHMELTEHEIVLTDYANVSPAEFFAEAVSYWSIGYKLPSQIQELINKTLLRKKL